MVLTKTEIKEIHTTLSVPITLDATEPLFIAEEKAQLMKEIGFYAHPEVKKYINNSKIIERNTLINTIKTLGYNVVSHATFVEVAKKYRLTVGQIENYIGDVPLKNLKEIKDFLQKAENEEILRNNLMNYKRTVISSKGLLNNVVSILAPEDMFQENPINKDPIVYAVLKNCDILIVSKWGLEANDQSIANPINN